MKLLDTTFLIDILRKGQLEELEALSTELIFTTRINVFETLMGIFSIKPISDREKRLSEASDFFAQLIVLDLDEKSALKAAEVGGKLNREGKTINPSDCLVAGIALSNGINTIITKNTKHFQDIEGLKVEGY